MTKIPFIQGFISVEAEARSKAVTAAGTRSRPVTTRQPKNSSNLDDLEKVNEKLD